MKVVSIWWNDKRIKDKHFSEEFTNILLNILEENQADRIDIKFPHSSIDTYTKEELQR